MRNGRRPKKDPLGATPKFGSLAQQRAAERDMQNLLVELSEMARQVTAQLDTRSKKLELLIEQADQKLRELQKAASANPTSVSVVSSTPMADFGDPTMDRIYTLADQGKTSTEISDALACPVGEVELILALRGRPVAA
jgi:ABC-type transporter Mla subunit MlaD